jgi:hypothetical protein
MNVVTLNDPVARLAAVLAAIGFASLAVFQARPRGRRPVGTRRLGWRKRGPLQRPARCKRSRRRHIRRGSADRALPRRRHLACA